MRGPAAELTLGDFSWNCTLSLIFPLSFFTDARGLSDEDALLHLRNQIDLNGSIQSPKIANAHHPAPYGDAYTQADLVRFEKVWTERGGQRVLVHLTTPTSPTDDLSARFWYRHIEPTMYGRTQMEVVKTTVKPRPDLREALLGSEQLTSSFTLHHPELNIRTDHGGAIGLDLLWSYGFSEPDLTAVSERCLDATGIAWLIERKCKCSMEELANARARAARDRRLARLETGQNSITFRQIPNKALFRQMRAAMECREELDYGSLMYQTQQLLRTFDPTSSSSEVDRVRAIQTWMDGEAEKIAIIDTPSGANLLFGRCPIGTWNKGNGRLKLRAGKEPSTGQQSQKIARDEIRALLPHMILDLLWTRDLVARGSHLETWLGPMATSFEETYERMRFRRMLIHATGPAV
jgi:hypothetical protein